MGLVQRAVEAAGVPTVGVSIVRTYSEEVRPPRTVFVRWPYGHPLGEAFNAPQQRTVIRDALRVLAEAAEPGVIVDLPYRWRRETYAD